MISPIPVTRIIGIVLLRFYALMLLCLVKELATWFIYPITIWLIVPTPLYLAKVASYQTTFVLYQIIYEIKQSNIYK